MAPLNSSEFRQLANNIQNELSNTDYACSYLHRIPGGSASFTFRGILQSPLVLPDERSLPSVIIKKATDFAAINSDFALDSSRSMYEDTMLKALSHTSLVSWAATIAIRTPCTFSYDPSSQIQIIEDLQPATDLASVLTSHTDMSLKTDFAAIGFALGSWLHSFHEWAKQPEQAEVRQIIRHNESSRDLKLRTTYNTIVDIARRFVVTQAEDLDVLEKVQERASREFKLEMQMDPGKEDSECHGLIHGDFWTGNVLLNPVPEPRLHIIDFEFTHLGHRVTDLGQMIGDLLEKGYMFNSEPSTRSNCEAVMEAFVSGYGPINDRMAYRTVIHAGVHMINWCARHPGFEMRESVEELMQRAVGLIVKAWKEDRAWFDGDSLRCLFRG